MSARFAPPTSDERELLLRYLHAKRMDAVAPSEGLSEEQARWTPDGQLVPIIGVISHLTEMERRWVEGRYLGRFPVEGPEWAPERTLAEVVAGYWAQEQRTEEIVRQAPTLDEPSLGGRGDPPLAAHEIFGFDEPVSLRWVLLHVLEEIAHHAGHADATREVLDGTVRTGQW